MYFSFFYKYIQLNIIYYMGCCGLIKPDANTYQLPNLKSIDALVGLLTISIKNIKLQNSLNSSSSISFFRLRMSNQQFNTKIERSNRKFIPQQSKCQFTINSLNKKNGRFLTIQMWDHNSRTEKDYANSLIDLAPFLKNDLSIHQRQKIIFVNYQRKPAGEITLDLDFEPYPYDYLHFRINALFIRKISKSQRWCSVKVSIGEQMLETKPKKQQQDSVPSWKNQPMLFIVPSFITDAEIVVLESNGQNKEVFGELKLDMQTIMNTHSQLMHNQAIYLNGKITGSITFDTSKDQGEQKNFSEAISPRKVVRNSSKYSSNSQFQIPIQNRFGLQSKTSQNSTQVQFISDKSIPTIKNIGRVKGKLPSLSKICSEKPTIKRIKSFDKIQEQIEQNHKSKIQNDESCINIIDIPAPMLKQQTRRIRKQSENLGVLKLIPMQQSRIEPQQKINATKMQYSFIQNPINVTEINKIQNQFQDSFMNKTLNISEIPQDQIPTRLQSGKFVYDVLANTMKYGGERKLYLNDSRQRF